MEKNVILSVYKKRFGKGKLYTHSFDTVTEAYNYYVKHYSTLDEWVYHLVNAHSLLSRETNEEIMECAFRHLFTKGCIVKKER